MSVLGLCTAIIVHLTVSVQGSLAGVGRQTGKIPYRLMWAGLRSYLGVSARDVGR